MKAAFTHPLPSFLFIKTLREENILSENINTTDGRGFIKLIISCISINENDSDCVI